MLGEIEFNDLYYPVKMVITPNSTKPNITIPIPQFANSNFTMTQLLTNFPGLDGDTEFNMPLNYDFFNLTVPQFTGFNNITIPNLAESDVITSPKPQFYPGTASILVFFFVLLVPVVIINLLVGLAVADDQER